LASEKLKPVSVLSTLICLEAAAQQDLFELGFLVDVGLLVALLEPVERRLGDVDVAGLDERLHVAEQER